MTQPAVFQGTFSDWKLVRTRQCVQIVIEVPIEAADQAYRVLGGMPDSSKSVWLAVARLDENKTTPQQQGSSADPARQDLPAGKTNGAEAAAPIRAKEKRRFNDLPLPQQAALLCQNPVFWAWLREEHGYEPVSTDDAAKAIRELCGVKSRAEIVADGGNAAWRFVGIRDSFDAWQLTQ